MQVVDLLWVVTAKERSLSFLQKQCFCEFPSYRKWHIRFSFIAFLSFSAGEDQWVQFHLCLVLCFFPFSSFHWELTLILKKERDHGMGGLLGSGLWWILAQESGLIYAVMGCWGFSHSVVAASVCICVSQWNDKQKG